MNTANAIAAELTSQTGAQWTTDDGKYGPNAILTRAGGLRIWISGPDWSGKDRHSIHWSSPHGQPCKFWSGGVTHEPETITVSAKKTPAQIAADIIRRTMPNAEKMQALLQEHIAREARRKSATADALEQLIEASGADPTATSTITGTSRPFVRGNTIHLGGDSARWDRTGYGTATVSENENPTVRIEINSMPAAVAVKLLDFMRREIFTA